MAILAARARNNTHEEKNHTHCFLLSSARHHHYGCLWASPTMHCGSRMPRHHPPRIPQHDGQGIEANLAGHDKLPGSDTRDTGRTLYQLDRAQRHDTRATKQVKSPEKSTIRKAVWPVMSLRVGSNRRSCLRSRSRSDRNSRFQRPDLWCESIGDFSPSGRPRTGRALRRQ